MIQLSRVTPPRRERGAVRKRAGSWVAETPEQQRMRRQRVRANLIEAGIEILPVRQRKFRNTPTEYNDETYDSAGEARYAVKLDTLVLAGAIIDWERAKRIPLNKCQKCQAMPTQPCIWPKGKLVGQAMNGYHLERVSFKPDFWVLPAERNGEYPYGYYVDYKGSPITETAAWKIKVKLWRWNVPFELRVAYRDGSEKIVATGNETGKSEDEQAQELIRDAIRSVRY